MVDDDVVRLGRLGLPECEIRGADRSTPQQRDDLAPADSTMHPLSHWDLQVTVLRDTPAIHMAGGDG